MRLGVEALGWEGCLPQARRRWATVTPRSSDLWVKPGCVWDAP